MSTHGNCVYTFYTQKLYKMYTTDVYKMYAKCTYTTFHQTFVYMLYTKSKELCQLNFVYKMFPKICRNVEYILCTFFYTFCIQKFVEMWDAFCIQTLCIQTFCIHFVYINSDVQKVCLVNIMYTICIQISYRMYIQIIVCRMGPLF